VNEKVAFEVAFGASMANVRAMTSMKHVGLNVAHDPLMSVTYMGALGGFVLVDADDPGQWSSQNEQDNRFIAEQSYIPIWSLHPPRKPRIW
jgi:indolepyruvate ferredoxin oxidoreductase alpha subunit